MPTKRSKTSKRRRQPKPNKLHQLRESLGLILLDVHRATGASQASIHRWEHDQGEPAARFRPSYAKVLGLKTTAELGAIIYADR